MVAPPTPGASPTPPPKIRNSPRAAITARTLRTDRWWVSPLLSFSVLSAFVIYGTYAFLVNSEYYYKPYISPFYSPCLAAVCRAGHHHNVGTPPSVGIIGPWWAVSPAILIFAFPMGFRLTCYYYRRAYYRAFWLSPPACAVAEPHRRYSGETRLPLILNNIHRYFFYILLIFSGVLTYDAVMAFVGTNPRGGHVGVGSFVLLLNATLLWAYTLSCHSCRHIVGGRLKHFSRHPIRFRFWGVVSALNTRHMQFAWASLVWVALTDLYVRLAAHGAFGHGGWI